jgi:hypothetical protein
MPMVLLSAAVLAVAVFAVASPRGEPLDTGARPTRKQALEDAARKAHALAPSRPADLQHLALFGRVVSVRPGAIVLRQDAVPAGPVGLSGLVLPDGLRSRAVRVAIGPRTSVLTGSLADLRPGAHVVAGGALADGVFTAQVIADLTAARNVSDAGPRSVGRPAIVRHEDGAAAPPGPARGPVRLMDDICTQVGDYTPPENTLEFTGCFGGPSFTYSTDFDFPLLEIPYILRVSLNHFDFTLALAGWQFDFPFQFAVDAPQPLTVGEPGAVDVRVLPLSPNPKMSYVGGLGFNVGFGFHIHTEFGCGDDLSDPCDFDPPHLDLAEFSSIAQTHGAPPRPGEILEVPAVECPGIPFGVPGADKLELKLKICLPFAFHGTRFTADVSADPGPAQRLSFDLSSPQSVTLTPPRPAFNVLFNNFEYIPDIDEQLQFKLKAATLITLWESEPLTFLTGPFEAVTTPFPTGAFSGSQPDSMRIYQLASPKVTSVAPSSGPFVGKTKVVVTGLGFTGATGVDVRFPDNPFPWAVDSYTVDSDSQITATMPGNFVGRADVIVRVPCFASRPEGCEMKSKPGDGSAYTYLPVDSTLALKTSTATPKYGDPVTISATLSTVYGVPVDPKGDVTFYDGGRPIGANQWTGNTATYSTSALDAGTHVFTASFAGDNLYNRSTASPVSLTVAKARSPKPVLTSSRNPAPFGQEVRFTATMTDAPHTTVVAFTVDGTQVATGQLVDDCDCTGFTTSALATGSHVVVATHAGDANHEPGGSSAPLTQTITALPSSMKLSSSPNPSVYGQNVTLRAGLTNVPHSATIVFAEDGTTKTWTAVPSDECSCATADIGAPDAGTHTFTSSYAGDGNHSPSSAGPVTHTVSGIATSTVLSGSVQDRTVDLTATVRGAPAGRTVDFLEGDTRRGQAAIQSSCSCARLSVLAEPGGHTYTATFTGDANYASSTSRPVTFAVAATPTTTTLRLVDDTLTYGDGLGVHADVSGPTGANVDIVVDGDLAAPGVAEGVDAPTGYVPAAGVHNVVAVYAGNDQYSGSSSGPVELTVSKRTTRFTSMTSSANPAPAGTQVTIKAEAVGLQHEEPVSLYEGDAEVATAPFQIGCACVRFNLTPSGGTHDYRARFLGNANEEPAASEVLSQKMARQATALTGLTADPSPSFPGQGVDLRVQVTNIPHETYVVFADENGPRGQAHPEPGICGCAMLNGLAFGLGTHTITASFPGDENYEPARIEITHTVAKATPAVTASSSANPSVYGDEVSVDVHVKFPAVVRGEGKVVVLDGTTQTGEAALPRDAFSDDFPMTIALPTLAGGAHPLTAHYTGGPSFTPADAKLTQTVRPAATTTTIAASQNPAAYGVSGVITATVARGDTGAVALMENGKQVASAILDAGRATFDTGSMSAGDHDLVAAYGGSANFAASNSDTLRLHIDKAPSRTAVASSSNPSVFGKAVTFTAAVDAPGSPAGSVAFYDGPVLVGRADVRDGTASITAPALRGGGHDITGVYEGNANVLPSTSAVLAQVVTAAPTATTAAAAPASSTYGDAVTLSAHISEAAATGLVHFYDGTDRIGTSSVAGGTASTTTRELPAGSRKLTAVYEGDGSFRGSSSAPMVVTVAKRATTTALTASPAQADYGAPVTFTVSTTPDAGALYAYGLEIDGAPAGVAVAEKGTATFTNATLPAGVHTIRVAYPGDANHEPSAASVRVEIRIPIRIEDAVAHEAHAADTLEQFLVTVTRSDKTVSVRYATADDTARAGADYLATAGTLTFAPGETEKVLPVTVLAQTKQATKRFFVDLSAPSGGASVVRPRATGTIRVTHPTCSIVGTRGDDVLTGRYGAQVICGMGGNDLINGTSGVDSLYGGSGDDKIFGAEGNDLVDGGPGADGLFGQEGDDDIRAADGQSTDTVDGGPGTNTCLADPGDLITHC